VTQPPATERLAKLVEDVFADGVLDPDERQALRQMYDQGGLTVSQVKTVFRDFMEKTWGEVIEDGVITPDERAKLQTIVYELRLPAECIPDQVRRVLDD
jgi:tellurite resistance protein